MPRIMRTRYLVSVVVESRSFFSVWMSWFHFLFLVFCFLFFLFGLVISIQIRRDYHEKKRKMGKIIFSSRMTRWWLILLPTNTWNMVRQKRAIRPIELTWGFRFLRNPRRRHVWYKIGNDTKDTRWRQSGYLGRWTSSSQSAAHCWVFSVCRVYSRTIRSKYQWRKNV